MREPRLFVPMALNAAADIEIAGEIAHYARNVLRLERGMLLRLFNGDGHEYRGVVGDLARHTLRVVLDGEVPTAASTMLPVHLGIGLSRGERMDWAIQKATELGVASITPLLLERCNAKLDSGRADNRLRHWRQIAIGASEQSGRVTLPAIDDPQSLNQWLEPQDDALRLVLHTSDARPLDASATPRAARLLVGPEGGLSPHEFEQALAAGFAAWSLGPRILRTETAPVVALAILQYRWGDMG